MNKPLYAGIGSRQTPPEILAEMTKAARFMENHNYVLRSGGAIGADRAFERGVTSPANKEIFLATDAGLKPVHFALAKHSHPVWENLNDYVKGLMARNVAILFGIDMERPVDFAICWAPDPVHDKNGFLKDCSGGTGHTVRVAYAHGIKVYNILDYHDRYNLKCRLQELKNAA